MVCRRGGLIHHGPLYSYGIDGHSQLLVHVYRVLTVIDTSVTGACIQGPHCYRHFCKVSFNNGGRPFDKDVVVYLDDVMNKMRSLQWSFHNNRFC